MLLRRN